MDGLQNALKKRLDLLYQARAGFRIQYQRRTRRLREIKILSQIAKDGCIFANIRAGIRATVCLPGQCVDSK